MAEYIERTEELILAVNAGARVIENSKRYHGASYFIGVFAENHREIPYLKAAEVLRGFDEIPAADVAPVVHAKWIDGADSFGAKRGQYRVCSRCNICIPCVTEVAKSHWQYCPNCGARMDGE